MVSTKSLVILVIISIGLFVFLPLVNWSAVPKFMAIAYWISFVACYFLMFGIQWILATRFKIEKTHLLLYLLHPYISIGVFFYFYTKRKAIDSAIV